MNNIGKDRRKASRTRLTFLLGSAAALLVACSVASDGGGRIAELTAPNKDVKAERHIAAEMGGFHNRGLRFVGNELFPYLKSALSVRFLVRSFTASIVS